MGTKPPFGMLWGSEVAIRYRFPMAKEAIGLKFMRHASRKRPPPQHAEEGLEN